MSKSDTKVEIYDDDDDVEYYKQMNELEQCWEVGKDEFIKNTLNKKVSMTRKVNHLEINAKCNHMESITDNNNETHIKNWEKMTPTNVVNKIINKGTGAGGKNTNYYGKEFENKSDNQRRLLNNGYIKKEFTDINNNKVYGYYLSKTFEDKTIIFVLQNGLKTYIMTNYNIELFRCPDEAYIIEYNNGDKILKILEKKEQNVEGSVENKLWAGPAFKDEYDYMLGSIFKVEYGFCVSNFLKNKLTSNKNKYIILNKIFKKHNIVVLFGDDADYFERLDSWINSSL